MSNEVNKECKLLGTMELIMKKIRESEEGALREDACFYSDVWVRTAEYEDYRETC